MEPNYWCKCLIFGIYLVIGGTFGIMKKKLSLGENCLFWTEKRKWAVFRIVTNQETLKSDKTRYFCDLFPDRFYTFRSVITCSHEFCTVWYKNQRDPIKNERLIIFFARAENALKMQNVESKMRKFSKNTILAIFGLKGTLKCKTSNIWRFLIVLGHFRPKMSEIMDFGKFSHFWLDILCF